MDLILQLSENTEHPLIVAFAHFWTYTKCLFSRTFNAGQQEVDIFVWKEWENLNIQKVSERKYGNVLQSFNPEVLPSKCLEVPNLTWCLSLFNRSLTLPLNMEPFMARQQCPHCDCIVRGLPARVAIYFFLSLWHVISRCSPRLRINYHRMLMQRFHGPFSLCTYLSFIFAMRHGTTAGAMLRHY